MTDFAACPWGAIVERADSFSPANPHLYTECYV